ncbi:PHP domain-containing protein [bacterium]|nr:PHP domain-containing protein [bacterium]
MNKFEDKEKDITISKIVDDAKLIKSKVITYGEIFSIQYDFYEKSKMHTFKFYISDHSKAICIKKIFSERNNDKSPNLNVEYLKQFKEGDFIKTEILLNEDNYEYGDVIGNIFKILPIKEPDEFIYKDDSNLPRIELNFHSNMSAFDGLHSHEQIIKFMKKQNIKALSINDFNSVQSFPSLYRLASKEKLDLIYGCEFSFAKKNIEAVYHAKHIKLSDIKRFVFFDLETTGLAPNYDEIIEFGAYFCDYHQVFLKDYQSFIYTTKSLDKRIIDLTRITNKELENAPNIKDFLLNLHEVIKEDDVLIAHNGIDFDIKFLNS